MNNIKRQDLLFTFGLTILFSVIVFWLLGKIEFLQSEQTYESKYLIAFLLCLGTVFFSSKLEKMMGNRLAIVVLRSISITIGLFITIFFLHFMGWD